VSVFLAKPVCLETMRECMAGGCACFTDRGYYIRYRNGGTDSMLFVCQDCYRSKFSDRCTQGDFDESTYQRTSRSVRYQLASPGLRRLIRMVHTGVRLAQGTCILLAVVLICAFCLKEQPQPRSRFPDHHLHLEVNTRGVMEQLERAADQAAQLFYSDGGDRSD